MSAEDQVHEIYVYRDGYRYSWRCLTCSVIAPRSFRRRMDADNAASAHEDET